MSDTSNNSSMNTDEQQKKKLIDNINDMTMGEIFTKDGLVGVMDASMKLSMDIFEMLNNHGVLNKVEMSKEGTQMQLAGQFGKLLSSFVESISKSAHGAGVCNMAKYIFMTAANKQHSSNIVQSFLEGKDCGMTLTGFVFRDDAVKDEVVVIVHKEGAPSPERFTITNEMMNQVVTIQS